MSASDYDQKATYNNKFSLKIKQIVQTSTGRCASDNISRNNENPLACYCVLVRLYRKDPVLVNVINML